ncbi:P-loop containing nucleoside triphosphate hydrolase protein [Aspergillus coremiiformis]|uniref:P-loop containing nucleoside triphosphate hydrolase protein n=1 Tax=Aspergillus coremiiformis TaxID=138285 RepID=A0A5N6YRU4_9EURO|nr:P-loop containing nucleoside triphosphate hydrolase protein [Aspergillus coremiiformis]
MTRDDIASLDDYKDGANIESRQAQSATFNLSFRAVQPVEIRVKDLSLQVNISSPIWGTAPSQICRQLRGMPTADANKTILHGVDAYIRSGRMSMTKGAMAGTTTFNGDANMFGYTTSRERTHSCHITAQPGKLNVIMGPSGSGKISLLNSVARGLHGSSSTRHQVHGDMLYNDAVPSESSASLQFAAGLRLSLWMAREEKNRRAEEVLLKMGLKECADNLMSELIKGTSGGEKRRVTIAIQILTGPKVLLLDEPTSGLDAFTAMSIIDVLKGLAEEGRTLIMTIHQSPSDLFRDFSSVLLLAREGYPVYAGEDTKIHLHFGALGYHCPRITNPADFVLDVITMDLQQADREAVTRERVKEPITDWDQKMLNVGPFHVTSTPAELGSLKRQTLPFRITYPLVVGVAIIMALFFAPLKNDYAAVQSRMGFIQEFAALYFVNAFYREEADDCYSAETFILQYTTLEVLFEVLSALIFGVLAAYADNPERSATMFLLSAFSCFCIINCSESLGIMVCTLFSHVGFAYAIGNLAPYAMWNQAFVCTATQRLADESCPIQNGPQVLQLYHLDKKQAMNGMTLGVCTPYGDLSASRLRTGDGDAVRKEIVDRVQSEAHRKSRSTSEHGSPPLSYGVKRRSKQLDPESNVGSPCH